MTTCQCPFEQCVCPCESCGDTGVLADGSPCRCARCPECGAVDPFEPSTPHCSTCFVAQTKAVQEAERAAGWDPSP